MELETGAYLELLQFRLGNGVGFGNNWNDIDFGVQLFHANQIQGLETVPSWADEVQADVYATVVIGGQRSFNLKLLLQVVFKLGVNVIDDGLERIILVDLISIADSVANCELEVVTKVSES